GARFDWKNAVAIGMLPVSCVSGAVEIVANAAGLGAVLALLDSKCRKRAAVLAQEVRVLELSEHPDFHTEFPFGVDFPPVAGEL
ncbi:MAG: ASKHA domain-containing protein, partial [Desulfomonilaceae bacterium]